MTSNIVTAEVALRRLIEGNKRYVEGSLHRSPHETPHRPDLLAAQFPFAVIVGCSDSRVPAEIVFDQGVGDLFVIRTAGHRVDDIAIASVEYAVRELKTRLVLVLGHQNCGAIKAAIDLPASIEAWDPSGAVATNHIPRLLSKLQEVITRSREMPGDLLNNAVHENVRTVMRKLSDSSSVLQEAIFLDGLKIVGGYYSLETGTIELMADASMNLSFLNTESTLSFEQRTS
jgi:carbonic anhydrase